MAKKVPATFFPKWKMIKNKRGCHKVMRSMVKNGYRFGIHGWTQNDEPRMAVDKLRIEYESPSSVAKAVLGGTSHPGVLFHRPAGGKSASWYKIGLVVKRSIIVRTLWTFNSGDIGLWNRGVRGRRAERVVWRRMQSLFYSKRDHIVLMHDNLPWTPRVVKRMLDDRRSRRLRFVTLYDFYGLTLVRMVLQTIGRIVDEGKRLARKST
jgi:peptidoglycan/xylan/chitin deacetylase (PgdA/CDA1 family)